MAYGKKTANMMDIPLSVASVFAPYVGDNGYKSDGANSIYVLSVANGTLGTYDEASATAGFGTIGAGNLVTPDEQTLTLTYNQSMLKRIQKTQLQDIPVKNFASDYALQQAEEVFVPAHDIASLGKLVAARQIGNKVVFVAGTDDIKEKTNNLISKVVSNGGSASNTIVWVQASFSDKLKAAINFTGSDDGYKSGVNEHYLGRYGSVKFVAVPDSYITAFAVAADKKAIVNVTPKMDPKTDVVIIDKVPGFSGIEIQMRDRGDTFVLNKKARNIATLEAS